MIDVTHLKDIREDKDITQEQMAKILGVKRGAYSLWELGISLIPFNHLYNFASYFNVSIDYVIGLTNNREKVKYNEFNLELIGKNLKKIRIDNNMTQQALAKELNITQACIVRYEKGIICISTANIYKYSKYFKTSITSLCQTKTHVS